jgi:Ca2+-binding RTX toxin-like protein
MSANGRYMAFFSPASNLVPNDTNGEWDIFVRDLQAGTTERVSVDSSGQQANGGGSEPSISADGRYVAFESRAFNLVAGDTNGVADIFVRERGSEECTVTGTEASDALTGTDGSDVICGLGGNDTIKGLGANDTLEGGSGNDTLLGGEGDDTLNGGLDLDTASFESSTKDIVASLVTNTATGEGSDTLKDIENLRGSSYYDELTGSPETNSIWGSSSTDRIFGKGSADMLYGGGGADKLWGASGDDTLLGDTPTAASKADTLRGEYGDDTLESRDGIAGNDTVDGGEHLSGDSCLTDATEVSIVNCEQ